MSKEKERGVSGREVGKRGKERKGKRKGVEECVE